jgi:hypothetical protein
VSTLEPLSPPKQEVRDPIPLRPEDYVVDQARIFTPAQHAEIANRLTEFANRQGIHIYLVSAVYLHGEGARARAERLASPWLKDLSRYGGVLVYDQGAKGIAAFGMACAEDGSGRVVGPDLLKILTNVQISTSAKSGSNADRMIAGAESMMRGFMDLKPQMASVRWNSPQQWLLISLVVGGMLLCLLLLAVVKRIEKASDVKNREFHLFPEVQVSTRYGAPHGGGVVTNLEFGNSAPPA